MRHDRLAAAWLLAVCVAAAALAAPPPAGARKKAKAKTLEQQLSTIVSVSWSNTPLRQALASLSASQQLTIVLDRRVDPEQGVQLTLSQQPLDKCLERIAEHQHLGYAQFGPIAYLGPPATARRLRTLSAIARDEVRGLGNDSARKLLASAPSHWDELAEPRELLEDLAAGAGVKLVGAGKVPHDLWPAADWPPLPWIDRATLIAAQFDLAVHVNKQGPQLELVPAPEKPTVSRTYPGGRGAEATRERWAEALPLAKVTVEGTRLRVEGTLEEQEQVERRLHGSAPRAGTPAGTQIYQLSIENTPLDRVVRQLGARLNLDVTWDRPAIDAAGIKVEQLVSVKIEKATLDELLGAVFAGTGLTFERKESAVSIRPARGE